MVASMATRSKGKLQLKMQQETEPASSDVEGSVDQYQSDMDLPLSGFPVLDLIPNAPSAWSLLDVLDCALPPRSRYIPSTHAPRCVCWCAMQCPMMTVWEL